jgi:hypothetical protein
MSSLPEWCGDGRGDAVAGCWLRLLALVAVIALESALGSGGAEAQVAIEVDIVEAETAPVETAAPDAPEDAPLAGPPAEAVPLTPEAMARQQIEQMAAQYEPMLMRVLQDELELVRTLHGDLPVEARRAIVAAGEKAVKEGAFAFSEAMNTPQPVPAPQGVAGELFDAVGRAFGFPIAEEPPRRADGAKKAEAKKKLVDPCQLIGEAVAGSLIEQIGEERGKDFLDELSKREQRRRAASVRRLVGVLDDDLFLSAKQRESIEAAIGEKWDEGLAMALDHRMEINGRKIYPGLPYKRVLPHLTPAQQSTLGDGKQSREIMRSNRQGMLQSQFFRRANLSQQTERDPWWFE